MRRRYGLPSLLLLLACSSPDDHAPAAASDVATVIAAGELVLASTTSTEDSGLFDVLLPAFGRAYPDVRVRLVAVGTGQALELGRRRDADVLLVHAPAAEAAFVAAGHAVRRCRVMYNQFLIVGPPGNAVRSGGVLEALRDIAAGQLVFISRGDDSGTHKKELELWQRAGVQPAGPWYLEAGQGMGEVLTMTSEKRGYTITDEATYLFMKERLRLDPVVRNDPLLFNPYSVITVRNAGNSPAADAFARWITSSAGQQIIGAYGIDRFGTALFTPDASDCG